MDNKTVCNNKWCKSTFFYQGDVIPMECPKCKSFNTELSGGVNWVEKMYNEPRFDGKQHTVKMTTRTATK